MVNILSLKLTERTPPRIIAGRLSCGRPQAMDKILHNAVLMNVVLRRQRDEISIRQFPQFWDDLLLPGREVFHISAIIKALQSVIVHLAVNHCKLSRFAVNICCNHIILHVNFINHIVRCIQVKTFLRRFKVQNCRKSII